MLVMRATEGGTHPLGQLVGGKQAERPGSLRFLPLLPVIGVVAGHEVLEGLRTQFGSHSSLSTGSEYRVPFINVCRAGR
jgi:hypothetical protein